MIIKNTVIRVLGDGSISLKEDSQELMDKLALVNLPFFVYGPTKKAGIKPVTQPYSKWDIRLGELQSKIIRCLNNKDCTNLEALIRRQAIMLGEKNHQMVRDFISGELSEDDVCAMVKRDSELYSYMITELIKGDII